MYKIHYGHKVKEYESLQALKDDVLGQGDMEMFYKIATFLGSGFIVYITDENEKIIAQMDGDTVVQDVLEKL